MSVECVSEYSVDGVSHVIKCGVKISGTFTSFLNNQNIVIARLSGIILLIFFIPCLFRRAFQNRKKFLFHFTHANLSHFFCLSLYCGVVRHYNMMILLGKYGGFYLWHDTGDRRGSLL